MARKWPSVASQLNMDRDRMIDFMRLFNLDKKLHIQKNADTARVAIKGIALVYASPIIVSFQESSGYTSSCYRKWKADGSLFPSYSSISYLTAHPAACLISGCQGTGSLCKYNIGRKCFVLPLPFCEWRHIVPEPTPASGYEKIVGFATETGKNHGHSLTVGRHV